MKRSKYNYENPREHFVGCMLNDEEMQALNDICNLWDFSYSSVIRTVIMQTHYKLVTEGMIKEANNG